MLAGAIESTAVVYHPRDPRRQRLHRFLPRFLLTAALLAAPVASRSYAKPLLLDRPDLHAHFWLSYGLSLTITEVLEGPEPAWGPQLGTGWALVIATGAVGALGLVKELTDDVFSGDDLLADGLGLLLNVGVQLVIEF